MVGITTMILTNVGLSIFNNWANSRQTQELNDKRMEFERAANAGQRERMLTLLREGQELTLKLEDEKHQERLKELNSQFDNLIKELAYSATIDYWPLKTLPIVMKNQALGNLLANKEDKVALHCILTPSNCQYFNKNVLQYVESELEAYCNIHWNNISGSPILFYSGAWTTGDAPTGTQVDSLRTALGNLPTLLITPYFRPKDGKLVFQVYTWGVGSDNNHDRFIIPEIEPTEFQRNYVLNMNWQNDKEIIDNAMEDIVPYLQCLIGYLADTYFWSAFGMVPRLPRMLAEGVINTDGMKYLVEDAGEYYKNLLAQGQEKSKEQPFADYHMLSLVEGAGSMWDECYKQEQLDTIQNKHIPYSYREIVNTGTNKTYAIADFPKDLYIVKHYDILDFADDILQTFYDRMKNTPGNILIIKDSGKFFIHLWDKDRIVISNPSSDYMYTYDSLYKAKRIQEFFKGHDIISISVEGIPKQIDRIRRLYSSTSFIII